MDIFEIATRNKFRFPSAKGDLTTEQLWDLPLIDHPARDVKTDLDSIARAINTELRSVTEESFVAVKPDPRKAGLQTKLDVVKHIIAAKVKEGEERQAEAGRAEKRRKLAEALASKRDEKIAALSEEEILKQLAEIDGVA